MSLPPGPPSWKSFGFVRTPFDFLDDCARRYGEWFTLRVPGLPPFVFTSDPEATRQVFAGNPEDLRAGEANASMGVFMGAESLLLLDGAAHLRERRLLLPAFHGERMHTYGAAIDEITEAAAAALPAGSVFPLHAVFQQITLEAILTAVFGVEPGPRRERLRHAVGRLFRLFGSPFAMLLGLPAFQFDVGGMLPWGRLQRLKRELDEILFAEFARRRAEGESDRTDVLSLLLAARDEDGTPMSDAALRDEMITLLLAGHETTAASLAWVVVHLLEHPEVDERLRAELETASDARSVAQLPYLDAVIKEASRLNPVVPNVARALRQPMAIAGHALPAGVLVSPCIYLAHRRPDLWPEPQRFGPERFLAGGRIDPAAYFPFGGGVRRCIGAAFATYEMKIVLARLLPKVKLRFAPGYRPRAVRSSIAFAPSGGLPVVA